jgi:hypothetical protein
LNEIGTAVAKRAPLTDDDDDDDGRLSSDRIGSQNGEPTSLSATGITKSSAWGASFGEYTQLCTGIK